MPWSNARPRASTGKRYGKAHERLRAQWVPIVNAGGVRCWRCGESIAPYSNWHLGHSDWEPGVYRGPEHASCNTSGAARKARLIQAVQAARSSTDRW